MKLRTSWLALLGLGACTGSPEPTTTTYVTPTSDTAGTGCVYPEAEEPMALGEVLFPYRWSEARHRDGRTGAIRLREVFCGTSDDIDWSPFDVLLFVSIPAW